MFFKILYYFLKISRVEFFKKDFTQMNKNEY